MALDFAEGVDGIIWRGNLFLTDINNRISRKFSAVSLEDTFM